MTRAFVMVLQELVLVSVEASSTQLLYTKGQVTATPCAERSTLSRGEKTGVRGELYAQ